MKVVKRILNRQKRRKVPTSFGWVDHDLVQEGLIQYRSVEALALYLFLITVADRDGLSYYSDAKMLTLLHMDETALRQARKELIQAEWIAYNGFLYQVLSLEQEYSLFSAPQQPKGGERQEAQSLRAILEPLVKEASHGPAV